METTHIPIDDVHISDADPTSATTSFPAYYLGRPVEMYERRYRRRVRAKRQPA